MDIREIRIFRVVLEGENLQKAKDKLHDKGYTVLRWERVDDVAEGVYYGYCIERKDDVRKRDDR